MLKKKIKDKIAEISESILPIKDNIDGSAIAIPALARKNKARKASPENPTLPDLYQLKVLYLLSKKKNKKIRTATITQNTKIVALL